jgi:AcrR family transcriptional regulator
VAADAASRTVSAPERGEATRERIVQAARELVVEHGYAGVNTTDVLDRAGVSRGGLYHHFAGKDQLMAAVVEALERDFMVRLASAVAEQPDAFSALSSGAQWYLDECMRSTELQRVGLLEGRAALGWSLWRETVGPYGLGMLGETLAVAMREGQIEPTDPTALAHMLLAALHEASAIISSAADPDDARVAVGSAVASLIDGLRVR